MADLDMTRTNPEEQLWSEIGKVHAGMLGIEGGSNHMQPMAPQLDREARRIWFYTRTDTDLAEHLAQGGKQAHFVVIGENHDYHACIAGELRVNPDRRQIDKHWNTVVSAWYEKGKDDPSLTMLEFVPRDAAVWASSGNSITFGWEIAKAKLTHSEPDVGERAHITF